MGNAIADWAQNAAKSGFGLHFNLGCYERTEGAKAGGPSCDADALFNLCEQWLKPLLGFAALLDARGIAQVCRGTDLNQSHHAH